MKEAQEHGQLLNQRQKLFGVPVVPFENLTKLIKEFEPYKNLWGTASGTKSNPLPRVCELKYFYIKKF